MLVNCWYVKLQRNGIVSEKFKVFTLSIPGFDAWKGQKGRIKAASDEGVLRAKDYGWGGR